MKTQEILDPANEAEAEMAAVAHQCLVAARDHSKADYIEVILAVGRRRRQARNACLETDDTRDGQLPQCVASFRH
jgi:hypothetical protein